MGAPKITTGKKNSKVKVTKKSSNIDLSPNEQFIWSIKKGMIEDQRVAIESRESSKTVILGGW